MKHTPKPPTLAEAIKDARYAMVDGNIAGIDVPVETVAAWLDVIEQARKAIEQETSE